MRSERYYIDSNILYFRAVEMTKEFTAEVKDIVYDLGVHKYVPSKCVEELIYLTQSGKIRVKQWKSAEDIVGYIEDELSYEIKCVTVKHLRRLATLPLFPEHKDSTDRIAIAQAIDDKIPIISSDREFHKYVPYGLKLIFNKR
jgi:PIN domain nuclease of toxin-antitoxin system